MKCLRIISRLFILTTVIVVVSIPLACNVQEEDCVIPVDSESPLSIEDTMFAAEQGDTQAQSQLGDMYYEGEGVPQDFAEAFQWYKLAAEQGNADAQYRLGLIYEKNFNYLEEVKRLKHIIKNGVFVKNEDDIYNPFVPPRENSDAPLFTKKTLNNLDNIVEDSQEWYPKPGENDDLDESIRWFEESADQNNVKAQIALGNIYYSKRYGLQNVPVAAKWFRRAAEEGDTSAKWKMGDIYAEGEGVPQDFAEALKWYRLAAEEGDARKKWKMGDIYAEGEVVPQDYAEAEKWYRMAAEEGGPRTQCDLGFMYENGIDLVQNYAEAVKWYRMAAEQGNSDGQWLLGRMYERGQGVPQSYGDAYFWYSLAAVQGSELVVQNRDWVKEKLSPEQVISVQKKTSEFYKKINDN